MADLRAGTRRTRVWRCNPVASWPAVAVAAVVVAVLAGCSGPTPTCSTPVIAGSAMPAAAAGSTPALGTKTDWSELGTMGPYLASLPGGVTFYEVSWCEIESASGQLDWSNPDTVVAQADGVGFTTFLKIRVGQCPWITGKVPEYLRGKQAKTESAMPQDLRAYAAFVKQVVERYSPQGVDEYAIENEVNSISFWDGTSEEYRRLVTLAARAIHNVDESAKVLDGGISSTAGGYGVVDRLLQLGRTQTAIDAYNSYFSRRIGTRGEQIVYVDDEAELRLALDSDQGRRNLDYVAVTNRLVDSGVVDARQLHFYEEWSSLPLLLDYVTAVTPADVQVELWELGSFLGDSQLSDTQRAADLVKVIAVAMSRGVTTVIWLPLNVDPADPSEDDRLYGLLGPQGETQTASAAFAALSQASSGARPLAVAGHGLAGVAFDSGDTSTAFVWSADCSSISVPLPTGSRLGSPFTTDATGPSEALVGDSPVQLGLPIPAEEFLATLS